MRVAPLFFVSANSKGLSFSVSLLESVLAGIFVSVDSKWFTGKHNSWSDYPISGVEPRFSAKGRPPGGSALARLAAADPGGSRNSEQATARLGTKTRTAADGCRSLEFSLAIRILLMHSGVKRQIGLNLLVSPWRAEAEGWLFAGKGELVAVGVFEDAGRAPRLAFGFDGELDAFGF